jgi:hypothetical protein
MSTNAVFVLHFFEFDDLFCSYKQCIIVCPISVSFETVYAAETFDTKLCNH